MNANEVPAAQMAPSEGLRKLTHIAIGFGAILLKWLSPYVAAAIAFAAFLFNWLVLPHLGGKRLSRDVRGYDFGMLVYPLMVCVLLIVFAWRIEIAAVAWIALAFGDGSATLIGRSLPNPKLPWNREKSLAGFAGFIEVALPVAYGLSLFLDTAPAPLPRFLVVAGAIVVAAIVESLPLTLDDNITVPIAAATTMWLLVNVDKLPHIALEPTVVGWLVVNALLAIAGYLAKSVDVSGAIGGFILGAILIFFGGWQLYVVLLIFFVAGTAGTRIGYRRKKAMGLEQEKGGRRGFSHAFSNVGVAAILALLIASTSFPANILWLAALASLATATADTVATEIGQLMGKRPFLPLSLTRVPVGTEGAISIEGTVAGAVASIFVAIAGVALWALRSPAYQTFPFGEATRKLLADHVTMAILFRTTIMVAVAAIAGSYIESVAGSWNRRRARKIPNGALNFFNTLVGAVIFVAFALIRG